MNYSDLRNLVSQANAAARIERAVACYEERKERYGDPDLPFNPEDVPALAWRAASDYNKYSIRHHTLPYNPSILGKMLNYPIEKEALDRARARYENIELDDIQISLCISSLKCAQFSEIASKMIKSRLPRGFSRKLRKTIKEKITSSTKP